MIYKIYSDETTTSLNLLSWYLRHTRSISPKAISSGSSQTRVRVLHCVAVLVCDMGLICLFNADQLNVQLGMQYHNWIPNDTYPTLNKCFHHILTSYIFPYKLANNKKTATFVFCLPSKTTQTHPPYQSIIPHSTHSTHSTPTTRTTHSL